MLVRKAGIGLAVYEVALPAWCGTDIVPVCGGVPWAVTPPLEEKHGRCSATGRFAGSGRILRRRSECSCKALAERLCLSLCTQCAKRACFSQTTCNTWKLPTFTRPYADRMRTMALAGLSRNQTVAGAGCAKHMQRKALRASPADRHRDTTWGWDRPQWPFRGQIFRFGTHCAFSFSTNPSDVFGCKPFLSFP